MLQVVPRKVDLKLFQRRYNVRLTNLSQMPFIFKIRSTNVNAFIVEPNVGFLRAQSNLSLLITVKTRNPFNERIQISYAAISDSTLGYEETWSKLKKDDTLIKKQIIDICLNSQEEQNVQDLRSSRKSSIVRGRRLSPHKKNSQHFQSAQPKLTVIKEQVDFKEYIASGVKVNTAIKEQILQHYERQKKRHYEDQQREELLYRIQQAERKYNSQVNQCERLVILQQTQKQQLQIAQYKIRENSTQNLKYQVEQSLGTVCDEHHTSFTGLALISLTAFFLGYLFAVFI